MIRIDFDGIWQKYSKVSRIEFACFSFHVGLLVINFSSFKPFKLLVFYRFKVGPFFMRHSVICAVIFFCQSSTCAAILFNELCLCVCDRMVGGPATAAHQSAESDGDSEPAAAARHVAELHD